MDKQVVKMLKTIKYEVKNERIAVITINRPEALNALNVEVISELEKVIGTLEQDESIAAMILTGEGRSFVAGADIVEQSKLDLAGGRKWGRRGSALMRRIEKLEFPTIAAVNGFALGGGCEIAMACDIILASEKAKFGQPETGLGILPGFGGTQRLARLVGKGRAKELIFTCDMIDANEAYRIGLANKVVPQAELLDTCKAMAEKIMSKGSYAISLAKEAINTGTETDLSSGLTLEADLFGLAFSTDDKKEGMTAFLEKRKANLTDF